MWGRSVTLGGGMMMVYGRKDGRWSGEAGAKNPRRSHSSYSAVSSPLGLYWGGSGASTGGLLGAAGGGAGFRRGGGRGGGRGRFRCRPPRGPAGGPRGDRRPGRPGGAGTRWRAE